MSLSARYQIPWDVDKRVIGMGWGDQEQLAVVIDDGNFLFSPDFCANSSSIGSLFIYSIHGVSITKSSVFGEMTTGVKVIECHFWGNGCVVMGSDLQLYAVEVWFQRECLNSVKVWLQGLSMPSKLKKMKLKRSGLSAERSYTSMAVVPPLLSRSGQLEVCFDESFA